MKVNNFLVLGLVLVLGFSFNTFSAENVLGGALSCNNGKSLHSLVCVERNENSECLKVMSTYNYNPNDETRYTSDKIISTDRAVIEEKVPFKGFSHLSKSNSVDFWEATNETPSEFIVGLGVAMVYDTLSYPFRIAKNTADTIALNNRIKKVVTKERYENYFSQLAFMQDESKQGEALELSDDECYAYRLIDSRNE